MKEQTAELLYSSLRRGMEATQAIALVQPLLEARRDAILLDGIAAFRGGTMTGEQALLKWAALAENEQLKFDLLGVESAGRRAGTKLETKV